MDIIVTSSQTSISPPTRDVTSSSAKPAAGREASTQTVQPTTPATAPPASEKVILFDEQVAPTAERSTGVDGDLAALVQEMVDNANFKIDQLTNASVRFDVDSKNGNILIMVVDRKTDEVIRQIPPEEMIAMRERMAEMRGMMLDQEG